MSAQGIPPWWRHRDVCAYLTGFPFSLSNQADAILTSALKPGMPQRTWSHAIGANWTRSYTPPETKGLYCTSSMALFMRPTTILWSQSETQLSFLFFYIPWQYPLNTWHSPDAVSMLGQRVNASCLLGSTGRNLRFSITKIGEWWLWTVICPSKHDM